MIVTILISSCTGAVSDDGRKKIVYLQDIEGLQSGNSQKVETVLSQLSTEFEFVSKFYPSQTQQDVEKNAQSAVENENENTIVFASGYATNKAIADSVSENTKARAVLVDYPHSVDYACNVIIKNEEAAYLAGVVAASDSQTGAIGYLGAFKDEVSAPVESGFYAGARTVNPQIKIYSRYTSSYNGTASAAEKTDELYELDVDVMLVNCGASALGTQRAENASSIKIICSPEYELKEGDVIARMQTDIQKAVYDILDMWLSGELTDDTYMLGLSDDLFAIEFGESISGIAKLAYNKYKDLLSRYALVIPKNKQELEEFDYDYINTIRQQQNKPED